MIEKGTFCTIVKELKKKNGLTNDTLSDLLHVSEDAVKKYLKKDTPLPHIEIMQKMADVFNVDVQYLLGSDFEKIEYCKINELTGLSEKASKTLMRKTDILKETLDQLLSNEHFEELLYTIYEYTNCHNKSLKVIDKATGSNDKPLYMEAKLSKEIYKSSVNTSLSKILESIYENNTPKQKDFAISTKYDELIEKLKILKKSVNPEAHDLASEFINFFNEDAKGTFMEKIFSGTSTEDILENLERYISIATE